MLKFKFTLVASCLLALSPSLVRADPTGVTGATEMTQMLNNVELGGIFGKQVATVAQLAQSYAVQLNQLREQILAGLPIPATTVIRTIQGVNAELTAVNKYVDGLKRAGSTVEQLKTIMDARRVEASIKNMTLVDYLTKESAKIQQGDARARQRLDTEKAITEQATEDLNIAKQLSTQIQGTAGVQQSVSLLNTQINRMIQQQARMTQIMANATGTEQADRMNRELADREKAAQLAREMHEAHKASIATQRANLRELGTGK